MDRSGIEPVAADEMAAMNRKRERDDKIGKLMGEYLLKGYKMLSCTCTICGTILLQDRSQQDYCIGCNEVDKEFQAASIPTVTCQTTAKSIVANSYVTSTTSETNSGHEDAFIGLTHNGLQNPQSENSGAHFEECIGNATEKLQERITWATGQLGSGNSVEVDIKLSELICACGKALKTLQKLQK